MPDDHRGPLAQRLHHGDVVLHQLGHSVRVHRRGPGRTPVAADVDGHRAVARVGQGRQLMTPRVPGLGEPVQQQDQRPVTLLDEVDTAGR
ncbi:hypothetical protein HDA41_000304 [Streptomyces caelestis]|uniref:Uncharacterized protein n=1 Tax=Streptomyces caelestis TaxID=36816 RepID=A0A7W9LQD9_9ACTN|nr:hypothetical protein [Streptomyces caelestis]